MRTAPASGSWTSKSERTADLLHALQFPLATTSNDPQVPRVADQQFNLVPIPEDIPELGIEARCLGTVSHTYPVGGEAGRGLHVEVSRPDGTTIGFTRLEVDEEGTWHVMTYTPFD